MVHVQELEYFEGWFDRDITSQAGAPAAVSGSSLVAFGAGPSRDARVYYLTAIAPERGHVHELARFGPVRSFHHRDVTADTGAPAAVSGSELAGFGTGPSRDPRVYYQNDEGHVRELSYFKAAGTTAT